MTWTRLPAVGDRGNASDRANSRAAILADDGPGSIACDRTATGSSVERIAEGVALVRAVERSKRIYMFAENYPHSTIGSL